MFGPVLGADPFEWPVYQIIPAVYLFGKEDYVPIVENRIGNSAGADEALEVLREQKPGAGGVIADDTGKIRRADGMYVLLFFRHPELAERGSCMVLASKPSVLGLRTGWSLTRSKLKPSLLTARPK